RLHSPFGVTALQSRGPVGEVLGSLPAASPGALAERTGHQPSAIAAATESLEHDRILERTRSGRYRLVAR
ncbi:MAG: hypothetical protein ACR2L4_11475, partial [Actinomycetota bacterium]